MKVRYDERVVFGLRKGTTLSAGFDVASVEALVIPPGCHATISTGVYVEVPDGYCGDLVHRSGMNAKQGALVYGTIDSDYRGELIVNMFNLDPSKEIRIDAGDYIAQLVVKPVYRGGLNMVYKIESAERGEGRHGSTGK